MHLSKGTRKSQDEKVFCRIRSLSLNTKFHSTELRLSSLQMLFPVLGEIKYYQQPKITCVHMQGV